MWSLKDKRAKASIWILYWYGLRPQELAHLRDEDVDLESQTLIIWKSKGNKDRAIPIPPSHISEWKNWFQYKRYTYRNTVYVIPNKKYLQSGLSVGSIRRLVAKADPIIGKHICPYMFRRTVATLSTEEGLETTTLAGILGHSSTKTTEIYAQKRDKTIRKRWISYLESREKEE